MVGVLIVALLGGGWLLYDNRKNCRDWRELERQASRFDEIILDRDDVPPEAIETGEDVQEFLRENRPLFC